jgi:hypothetical protein
MKNKLLILGLAAVLAMACWASAASATQIGDFVSNTDPSTGLAAEAIFDYTGTTLTITLINTQTGSFPSTFDSANTVCGLFFNATYLGSPYYVSSTTDRTNASAVVATGYPNANGSLVITGTSITYTQGTNISSHWAYDTFDYGGSNQGVGAAGFSGTGTQPNFDGQILGASGTGTAVDGVDYGILPAGYVTGLSPLTHINANTGVTGQPLVWNAVVFEFTGVMHQPDITQASFQYGTNLSDNFFTVPLPPSALLLGSGLLGLMGLGWRRRRQS